MKLITVLQNTPAWFEVRRGKITGSKIKDIFSPTGIKKQGYWELVAENIGIDDSEDIEWESALERGSRLEPEAIKEAEKLIGKKIITDNFMISDIDDRIALSPDGYIIDENGMFTEAVEVKCLSTYKHVKTFAENKVPKEFKEQLIQYFVVMEDLQVLNFIFYDPRIPKLRIFNIQVKRKTIEKHIDKQIEKQKEILEDVTKETQQILEKYKKLTK
jgi:putative phage-type endonuclease